MNRWHDFAAAGELAEGGCLRKDLDGITIAVFRVDGALHAIEDACTHDGGRLTGGTRDGCRIVCPRHGAAFDLRTGAVLAPPAYGPLTTFAARTVDDRIEIAIPDDF